MKKKRKLKRNIKYLLGLIILILTLILCYNIYSHLDSDNRQIGKSTNKEIIPKEKTSKISMVCVGDMLVHDRLYNDSYNGTNYDFKPYLRIIKDYIKEYDLKYYNQETILGGTELGLSSYPSFNSPQEVGDAMVDAGFNIVSLATNHTLDRGVDAILNSRTYWNKQKDVYAIGSYSSFDEKNTLESKIFEKNGLTYGILNYTYGTNGIPVPYGKEYLVNLWQDDTYKETVLKDISRLRDKVDLLMVAMHWGIEYTHEPTAYVKETARFLADNGVDIIIGTHSHSVQPTEFIGNTLVIYSLGNFLAAQNSESCTNYKCNIGLMTSFDIVKEIKDNKKTIKIENVYNELLYAYHNNYHNYLVIPFSNSEIKTHLNNYQDVYNNYKSIIASSSDKIKIKELAK